MDNKVSRIIKAINENIVPLGGMTHIDTEAIKDGGELFTPYRANTVVADHIYGDHRCLLYESEQYRISLWAVEIQNTYKQDFGIELQLSGILAYLLEDLSFYKVESMPLPFLEMQPIDYYHWEHGVLEEVLTQPEFIEKYTNKLANDHNNFRV